MHSGDAVPRVATIAAMQEAVREMSAKGLGITAVTEPDGALAGCITDGDLRRLLENRTDLLDSTAGDCMHRGVQTISADALASAALKVMEDRRITALFVEDQGRLEGIVHLHDLWRLQLF